VAVEPAVTFAFTPHVRLAAGASVAELQPLPESTLTQRANAGFAVIGFERTWRGESGDRQSVDAAFQWRAGLTALGSDLAYRRSVGHARYEFRRGPSMVIADFRAGRITGRAPLFERFSLGDSMTLRGWSKFAIAPVGADRMVHQSVEYRYRAFAYFFDAGSVWRSGGDALVRLSTGVGFHGEHAFVTLGVPLNADDVEVAFIMGVRF
jgi:hypothetical protein